MSDPIRHPFLRLEGVTKRYGGVTALANVDFACSLGTIHAVVGENGAGKSSLMKIIAGVIRPDEGRIYLDKTSGSFRFTRRRYPARDRLYFSGAFTAA